MLNENQMNVFGPGFVPGKVSVKHDATRALGRGGIPADPIQHSGERTSSSANQPKTKA